MGKMKTTVELANVTDEYIDVDMYLTDEKGRDWKERVFRDKESGEVFRGTILSAKPEDCFEEAFRVPRVVREKLNALVPRAVRLMNKSQ